MAERKRVITIGRTFGSGGRTVAKMLSEELGIPYLDREIIKMASEQSGINEAMFGEKDERIKKLIHSHKAQYKGVTLPPESAAFTSDNNLFEIVAKTIREAAQSDIIIVGRCADYILKDDPDVISIFVYASEENCIERLRRQLSGTDVELRKRMHQVDKYRSEYYEYYTGAKWNDARNYDLCIDSASMSYDKLIRVIKNYIAIRSEE